MFPLRDNIPPRTFPFVNYLMIALCAVAFLLQLGDNADGRDELAEAYGMVPKRVLNPDEPVIIQERIVERTEGTLVFVRDTERELAEPRIAPWLTLFTCMFLHGGWMHFLGNMWFLHIFGDNVEDRFGHLGYVALYLGCGLAAGLAHLATNLGSPIPTIGASGAIAGVMGAYMICYPRAMVLTLIPFILIQVVTIPAPIFLGIWFLLQLFQGTFFTSNAEGVAWWAHIGGFAAGFGWAFLMEQFHALRPKVEPVRPKTGRIGMFPLRFRE
jgi:membrane associated rhomboid family serine protease